MSRADAIDPFRALLRGLEAEMRRNDALAQTAYASVRESFPERGSHPFARVAGRRAAAFAGASNDFEEAIALRSADLARIDAESAATETLAAAEDELALALVAAGRLSDAREVYARSAVTAQELSAPGRAFRLRATLACGVEDRGLLERVADDASRSEKPVVENVVTAIATAANAHAPAEAPHLYEALALLTEQALAAEEAGAPLVLPKRLEGCAKRLSRAKDHQRAERCWRLVWLDRRRASGERHPATLAARIRMAAELGALPAHVDEARREYEWLLAATRGEPATPKTLRWTILNDYAQLPRQDRRSQGKPRDPILDELKTAKRMAKEGRP